MGGSKAAQMTAVDCSVGTIVWVRRRNGSWWPGKILGHNELSVSHLMSPRSGTPVKLLGREDASVDWYNMEKSKRVKAFRCGEFDDCIVRAESCAGVPTKKREKYARREDAILHALELEKQQLEQKQQSSCLEAIRFDERKYGAVGKLSENSVIGPPKHVRQHDLEDCNGFLEPESHLDAVQSVVSIQQKFSQGAALRVPVQKIKRPNDGNWEDDGTEGTPRMRGLQDLGLRIAPIKKPNMATLCEDIRKIGLPENHTRGASCIGRGIGSGNLINGNKGSSLTLKRKRSQIGHAEEFSFKRRDRRRPLTQVLQCSAKLPVPRYADFDCIAVEPVQQGVKERGVDSFQSKQVKKSSFSALPSNNSDCTETSSEREISFQTSQLIYETSERRLNPVSLIADNSCSNSSERPDSNCCDKSCQHPGFQVGETALTDSTQVLSMPASRDFHDELVGRHVGQPVQGQMCLMSKEGLDETQFSSYLSQHDAVEQITGIVVDAGVSKWQAKGKRNARHLSKKHSESTNGRSLVETDDTYNAPMYVASVADKVHINEELKANKVIGNANEEPESSQKVEKQLNYHFVPDGLLVDGSDSEQCNVTVCANGRQQKIESSVPEIKPAVQYQHNQEKVDPYSLEIKAGSFLNGNSQAVSPLAWESIMQESLASEEVLAKKWLGQIDRVQARCQEAVGCFDSRTFLGVTCEMPKSLGENQLKQSVSLKAPKLVQPAEKDSREALLVEVDVGVDVHASYQGEHVPLVSLMSRLNGKAIVGHPVTVETLEDGYSDLLLGDNSCMNNSIVNFQSYDVDTVGRGALQPVWRTARRTTMQRVRRSCPSKMENDVHNSSRYLCCENGQPLIKTVYTGHLNHKIRFIRKNLSHMRRPSLDKKLPKKFLKRVGLSSQKTRTLSSIAVEHKFKNETNELGCPLKMAEMPPVSCIPVKLIFSRIKEVVGSSSKSGSHGFSSTGLAGKKPL